LGSPGDGAFSSAGLKVNHTPYWKLAVSPKSAQQSIQGKRALAGGPKKRFFQAKNEKRPRKQSFPGTPELVCNEHE
jgi:hypothetical protein